MVSRGKEQEIDPVRFLFPVFSLVFYPTCHLFSTPHSLPLPFSGLFSLGLTLIFQEFVASFSELQLTSCCHSNIRHKKITSATNCCSSRRLQQYHSFTMLVLVNVPSKFLVLTFTLHAVFSVTLNMLKPSANPSYLPLQLPHFINKCLQMMCRYICLHIIYRHLFTLYIIHIVFICVYKIIYSTHHIYLYITYLYKYKYHFLKQTPKRASPCIFTDMQTTSSSPLSPCNTCRFISSFPGCSSTHPHPVYPQHMKTLIWLLLHHHPDFSFQCKIISHI